MTLLGEVRVSGTFDARGISKGVDKARKKLRTLGDSVQGLRRKFKDLKPAISAVAGGVTAGLGVMAAFGNHIATTEQEAGRLARGLGISRVSLLKFQKAAGQLGIATDVINDALRELNRRSAEAVTGTGSMADALKMLSIDAQEFAALRLEDRFSLIANKLAGLQSTAQRGFLTDEIFGGASDEITGSVKQLDKLARSIDGVKAAAEAKVLSQFSKDWKEITTDLKAAGQGLLVDVGPAVLEAVRGLRALLEETGAIKERHGNNTGKTHLFDQPTTIGNAPVKATAAVFMVPMLDGGTARHNMQLERQIDRERLDRYRNPQVNNQPIQLTPPNL